jgi:hypothetical protein
MYVRTQARQAISKKLRAFAHPWAIAGVKQWKRLIRDAQTPLRSAAHSFLLDRNEDTGPVHDVSTVVVIVFDLRRGTARNEAPQETWPA